MIIWLVFLSITLRITNPAPFLSLVWGTPGAPNTETMGLLVSEAELYTRSEMMEEDP